MDSRKLFDRTNNRTPFLLLDGYGSITELESMQCMNYPDYPCTACIGITHEIPLWQAGYPSEQNGSINMALTKVKEDIVAFKDSVAMDSKLTVADGMILIRKS